MYSDRQLAIGMMGRQVHFTQRGTRVTGEAVGFDPRPYRRPDGSYLLVHVPGRWESDYLAVPFADVEELRFSTVEE